MNYRFTVVPQEFAVASATNMTLDDTLELWRQACPEKNCPGDGTEQWIRYRPTGCVHAITTTLNPLKVDLPGVYEFRFTGADNPDVEVCIKTYPSCC